MKKEYNAPKAEKIEFSYTETVVASVACGSGLTTIYTARGRENCDDTYVGTKEVWKADNL